MGIMDLLRSSGAGREDGPPGSADDSRTGTIREIVAALDSLPPDRARYIALFAYVLGRVAQAVA